MDKYDEDLKKIKRLGKGLFYLPIESYALEKNLRRYNHKARCYHPLLSGLVIDEDDPSMGFFTISNSISPKYLDYLRDINGFQWIDKTLTIKI